MQSQKEPSMPEIVLPTGMDEKRRTAGCETASAALATTEARMAATTVARERRTKLATIYKIDNRRTDSRKRNRGTVTMKTLN